MGRQWSEKFVQCFLNIVEAEAKIKDFKNKYNTQLRLRTKLMLGSGADRESGVIYRALTTFYDRKLNRWINKKGNIKQEIVFERYSDCVVYKDFGSDWDDWYKGELYQDMVIEVENDLNEFQGTFCDLLRTQSKKKVGIFYYDISKDKDEFIEEKKNEIRHVLEYFSQKDFLEAEGTEYLFLFLPDNFISMEETFKSNIIALNFMIVFDNIKTNVNKILNTMIIKYIRDNSLSKLLKINKNDKNCQLGNKN